MKHDDDDNSATLSRLIKPHGTFEFECPHCHEMGEAEWERLSEFNGGGFWLSPMKCPACGQAWQPADMLLYQKHATQEGELKWYAEGVLVRVGADGREVVCH